MAEHLSHLDVEALLQDAEDMELVEAVAAHLAVLNHRRKRKRAARVGGVRRYHGSVLARPPNKQRNFTRGLRSTLSTTLGWQGTRLCTTRMILSVAFACRDLCLCVCIGL